MPPSVGRSEVGQAGVRRENQPYVVPVYLAYHQTSSGEAYLYGFTTPGQKVAWMRPPTPWYASKWTTSQP